jgi:ABC-type branched-subunit amino acid transport system substrate-binding protein
MAPGTVQSQNTIKIGVPAPLSGSYASAGTDILNGAKLAAARINQAGGVLGKHIELLPVDDACDADTAAQAAQKLVDAGVVAVVGGYCSSAALPEARVFNGAGIPFVLDASTNPQLTEQGWNDVLRAIGRDDVQGSFAAKFIKDSLHAKRVAVVNDNTTYAKGLAENAVAALKKEGVDVVYDDAITPGQTDYSPTLNQIAKLPAGSAGLSPPDVIYYTGYFAEAGLLVKEARPLGLKKEK